MKRIYSALFILLASLSLVSCIKNENPVFERNVVEMDAATWNSNAAGQKYPILTRVPAENRAVGSADPLLTRNSGTVRLRVNLLGRQRSSATEVSYTVDASSTAVAGTHYAALPGKVTIPAGSSFGYIDVQILNPGASTGSRTLILTLTGNSDVPANENYKTVGLSISQS